MSGVYIVLLAISGFMISGVGAYFSIVGLAALFAGASFSVGLMAAVLEFSKLVVAGFLYRYWAKAGFFMRLYLSIALATLVGITSMGIFGYLSNAYQKSSSDLKTRQLRVGQLQNESKRIDIEVAQIEKFISEIPVNRISKKFEVRKEADPHLQELKKRQNELLALIGRENMEILQTSVKVGPLIYVAQVFDIPVDIVAQYLILVFVMVFDPLAICLVFAWSLALKLREEEENRFSGKRDRTAKKDLPHSSGPESRAA